MQYILVLCIFTNKTKRKEICYHSIDIYTCTAIFLFYKCKMIQMSYSTHLLIVTGFSTLQSKYNMLSNYHSCKQLTPKWHINTHQLDSIKFTHDPSLVSLFLFYKRKDSQLFPTLKSQPQLKFKTINNFHPIALTFFQPLPLF